MVWVLHGITLNPTLCQDLRENSRQVKYEAFVNSAEHNGSWTSSVQEEDPTHRKHVWSKAKSSGMKDQHSNKTAVSDD